MISLFKKYPLFIYSLCLFFVLHGFTENYDTILLKDAFILLLKYFAFAIFAIFLFWLFYKNFTKASLIVFLILCFNFFFGTVVDFLNTHFGNFFLTKYTFILPATAITFIIVIIYIKKTNRHLKNISHYLNWLFLILILIDTGTLIQKLIQKKSEKNKDILKEYIACDSCRKPDIYLILTDEYAGQSELQDIFNFDNSQFLDQLKKRGYHVSPKSSGNYNFTHYCMASMLNMQYLEGIDGIHGGRNDLSISYKTLRENKTLQFLSNLDYSFYNYSIFNFNKHPSPLIPTFIPGKTLPITAQTFIHRAVKDLGYHLITTFKLKWAVSKFYYADLNNNDKVFNLTKAIATKKTVSPKFVYTHLAMPHYRYYFDSKGVAATFEKVIDDNYCSNKKGYIEYLQYVNGKLLTLIDHIAKSSEKPPVIILMSDHGYRQFLSNEDIKNVDKKYYFMNLNAVYFPDRNYSLFYDSISNVNQFRVVLNSLFNQKLPLLKDSTIFLAQ